MRSSSRLIVRASLAVSVSPTSAASVSIAVYAAISAASSTYSSFAFFSSFSLSLVPRSASSGPWASASALPNTLENVVVVSIAASGTAEPSCLMRRSTWRACWRVSVRCCWSRFLYGGRFVMPMWACSAVSSWRSFA